MYSSTKFTQFSDNEDAFQEKTKLDYCIKVELRVRLILGLFEVEQWRVLSQTLFHLSGPERVFHPKSDYITCGRLSQGRTFIRI